MITDSLGEKRLSEVDRMLKIREKISQINTYEFSGGTSPMQMWGGVDGRNPEGILVRILVRPGPVPPPR
jgi:hypothetical protein